MLCKIYYVDMVEYFLIEMVLKQHKMLDYLILRYILRGNALSYALMHLRH